VRRVGGSSLDIAPGRKTVEIEQLRPITGKFYTVMWLELREMFSSFFLDPRP
jgi:hypothetical protein